ncbi:hypothetical protein RYA05_04500 [Pseudomonas syringae pv. actinidiae]|nr:hypothetical protein [Pseudomonas syringae pv. actinidiae]
MSPTREEFLEQYAYSDHKQMIGKVIMTSYIGGFVDNDSVVLSLSHPATVIVLPKPGNQLIHWNDDWLDPSWDVALAVPHPELEGVRSLVIDAKGYHIDGVQTSGVSWVLSPDQSFTLPEEQSCPTS